MKIKQSSSTAEGMDLVQAIKASQPGVKTIQRAARLTGEGCLFGIGQNQIEPFLAQRGFENIHSGGTAGLKRRYFTGPNANRQLSTGVAIATTKARR